MTSEILERVLLCSRMAFISNEVVDLQRVQCVSMSNGVSFDVTRCGGEGTALTICKLYEQIHELCGVKMLIKYKNKTITLRELCIDLKINYDNFMSWCHKHALQNYQTALNYYKRTLKHGKK